VILSIMTQPMIRSTNQPVNRGPNFQEATHEFARAHRWIDCARSDAEPSGFIRKYIFSVDHKVIGIQYFLLALTAVVIGIVLSLLMRFHLVWPNATLPFVSGGQMSQEQYLALSPCTAPSWSSSC